MRRKAIVFLLFVILCLAAGSALMAAPGDPTAALLFPGGQWMAAAIPVTAASLP